MRALADTKAIIRTVFLLLFLIAGGFVFRSVFALSVLPPPARMQGETTQAYRYTRMVSEGNAIPALDTLVMLPSGMNTGENSIFEEYIAGGIHRITGGDFDSFLTFFSRLFPLFAIPVLFFWMRNSGFSFPESFTGGALYAVFLPALLRTRGESFYRETVALPLILLAMALIDISIRRKTRNALIFSISAALTLFMALACWKVTGFFSFFLFVWLAFRKPGPGIVLPLAVAQVTASLVLSHMRHDGAIFSPATIMALAAVVSSFFNHRYLPWAGILVSFIAGVAAASSSTGHVASVLSAKLRFFFSHPADPSLLSSDARLFWVSGYTSPSPGQMILLFGAALLSAVSAWKLFSRKTGGTCMLYFVPVSLAGYLFFDRLHVILAAAIIPPVIAAARGRNWILPVLLLLFGTQSMFAPGFANLLQSAGLPFNNSASLLGDSELDDLINWAEENRGTMLSFWHISGLLSAYAETPVVTHTFFENAENRKTIMEFSGRMYGTEQEMVDFMQEKGAEYLAYQADFFFDRTPGGLLYLAGLREIPQSSLALKLHYYPESLQNLVPVWQGPSIRIFRLGGERPYLSRKPLWEIRYASFICSSELASAVVNAPVETGINLADLGMVENNPQKLSAALLLFSGVPDEVPADAATGVLQQLLMAYLAGNYSIENLEEDFISYLEAWGPDPQLRFDLVRLLRDAGLNQRADYHMAIIEGMGVEGI
jgi:hypothetical protein